MLLNMSFLWHKFASSFEKIFRTNCYISERTKVWTIYFKNKSPEIHCRKHIQILKQWLCRTSVGWFVYKHIDTSSNTFTLVYFILITNEIHVPTSINVIWSFNFKSNTISGLIKNDNHLIDQIWNVTVMSSLFSNDVLFELW